jgi:hypothetical protein
MAELKGLRNSSLLKSYLPIEVGLRLPLIYSTG